MAPAAQVYDTATELRYEQLNNEIKTIKVQLATMTDVQKKEMLFTKVTGRKQLIEERTGVRISEQPLILDYTVDEMAT